MNDSKPQTPHHLWEINHDHKQLHLKVTSKWNNWQEFAEYEASHKGYCSEPPTPTTSRNLVEGMHRRDPSGFTASTVLRWNWFEEKADGDRIGSAYRGRPHHRNGRLRLWRQHGGYDSFTLTEIRVCRDDEPEVVAFLTAALEFNVNSVWYPLSANGSMVAPVELHPWHRKRAVWLHDDSDFFRKHSDQFWD
ncbi:hypothetical protein [Rhizobium sp. NZLR4b]|uniref:hypothetical protein n=1 Tax=Rhizobium sp. NZLR4b TaxID=2731102 RepID=UPI001C835B10|nr:hypothetical protein [Rhizobium sp. NZLR4b]MBX5164837.1 hypothetical protein [Rhizobium sp. NZLR4b]